MPTATSIPIKFRSGGYTEERHSITAHAGRLRATVRALAMDIEYVLDEVPDNLHDRVRAVFAHDIRRAKQVLSEVQ